MSRRVLLSSALFLAAPAFCLGQSSAPAPFTRVEILGRLATGYSRSNLAHMIKVRGVAFSPGPAFLEIISRAGGNGVLYDRLVHAEQKSSVSTDDAAIQHLAKCAELLQQGYTEGAEPECRAAINENPHSPWPLLATIHSMDGQGEPSDRTDLARRAIALNAGASPFLSDWLGATDNVPAYNRQIREQSRLNPDDLDTALFASRISPDGQISYAIVQNPEAIDALESQLKTMLSAEPDYAIVHMGLAHFYQARSELDLAIREIRTAIDLEPDNAEFHIFWPPFTSIAMTFRHSSASFAK